MASDMSRAMESLETSIDVDVPLRATYDQWTQFEDFPRFMEGVTSVTQVDDSHVHWITEVAGRTKEWDAEITRQLPDEEIAWVGRQEQHPASKNSLDRHLPPHHL